MHKENILLVVSILACITLLLGVPATWKIDALGPLVVVMLVCAFLIRQEHRIKVFVAPEPLESSAVSHATQNMPSYTNAHPSPLDVHITPAQKPRRRKVAVSETV